MLFYQRAHRPDGHPKNGAKVAKDIKDATTKKAVAKLAVDNSFMEAWNRAHQFDIHRLQMAFSIAIQERQQQQALLRAQGAEIKELNILANSSVWPKYESLHNWKVYKFCTLSWNDFLANKRLLATPATSPGGIKKARKFYENRTRTSTRRHTDRRVDTLKSPLRSGLKTRKSLTAVSCFSCLFWCELNNFTDILRFWAVILLYVWFTDIYTYYIDR